MSPSSPSSNFDAFVTSWSRLSSVNTVQGSAVEPILLDNFPSPGSPRQNSEPFVISISDDDDDDNDDAIVDPIPFRPPIGQGKIGSRAARSSVHPWSHMESASPGASPKSKLSQSMHESLGRATARKQSRVSSAFESPSRPQERNTQPNPGTGPTSLNYTSPAQPRGLSPRSSSFNGSPLRSIPRVISDGPTKINFHSGEAIDPELDTPGSEDQIMQDRRHGKGEVTQEVVDSEGYLENREVESGKAGKVKGSISADVSTVGTESPLVERLKPRKSRRVGSTTDSLLDREEQTESHEDQSIEDEEAVVKIEKSLRQFEKDMQNDHSLMVKWVLHDAGRDATNPSSKFMDEQSPFASSTSAHFAFGDPIPVGHKKIKLETSIKHRAHIQLISRIIKSETPRIPRYHAHTYVKRNILTADDDVLRYMPYLGEDHSTQGKRIFKRTREDLKVAFAPQVPKSSHEYERQTQLRAYLDTWLADLDLGVDQERLVKYILSTQNWDIDMKLKDIKTLLKYWKEESKEPKKSDKEEKCRRFVEAFLEVFPKYPIKGVILGDKKVKELVELAKKIREDSKQVQEHDSMDYDITKPKVAISDRFSTYTNWTCLICGALYCQTHGDYREETIEHSEDDEGDIDRPQKPKYNNIHQLLIMDYNDLLRKQDARLACKSQDEPEISRSIAEPCSKECYRIFDRETAKDYQVSPEQRVKIESMCISLQEHPKRPCDISFVLGLPCWQVDREIRTQIVLRKIGLPPGYIPTKKPDWYDNKRKILKDHWQDHTNAHLHQERWQSLSCSHDGPCDKRCPCFSANLLCESFCGCPDDCARKWTGCACHSSGKNCQTETCVCIQMNRECGPQCMSCGAIPRIKAFNKYNDELFTTGCQNVFIQRGVPKKMIIGESQLVGFGLYLAEPVRKGQYLSEYTGEAISLNESERRGVIYDRKYLSFLFDLNSEWVIDAARLGNKTRFINHAESEKDGLNCAAKIVLVNGEHRIKFYALRDIKVGEELLFNYGKKFAAKQGLNKKLPKPNADKKGLVVGQDAIDELDGLDPAIRRGRNTALRGGRGGKKARKTAGAGLGRIPTEKKPGAVVHISSDSEEIEDTLPKEDGEEEDDFLDDGDDEDEDEDLDDAADEDPIEIGETRRKRQIRRPLRYTR